MKNYTTIIASPLGKLGLLVENKTLTKIDILKDNIALKAPTDASVRKIVKELDQYFENATHTFSIDLHTAGTPFQQKVWRALQSIPSGHLLTYGQLAKKLKSSARAIGQACKTNPIPVIIPCHRIIAANDWGGYAGAKTGRLMDIKKWLIAHEHHCDAC